MSFFNGASGAIRSAPAANENSRIQNVAVANNTVSVLASNTGGAITGVVNGDLHGQLAVGTVAVLLVGAIVFYAWTRNIQGGG